MDAAPTAHCLDPETMAAYVDGRLTEAALGAADRHVDSCTSCRRELSALAAVHTAPVLASNASAPADGRLGRYVVMRELGHGAMGTVFRAYDPELDRAVAVKVLHAFDADAYARLRREAQAMAKLAHPNVVAVYDVVAERDLVFVAMELVEGTTLRERAKTAPWRDVLDACIAAGRGLAAAHAAKLVHRDFKPDNVLCGVDGRVAVTDFGLAEPLGSSSSKDAPSEVAGTPAYMAPELFAGNAATPASDQFSFCATAYELLYGQRAFAADDLRGLRAAIVEGVPREPPATTPVPDRVWRVLARGLARDPDARFAGMTELLDTLAADPTARRRKRIALAAALVGALGTGALVVQQTAGDELPSCAMSEGELGVAWDPGRRSEVEAAVRTVGGDVARVAAAIDTYAARWLGTRRDACEATRLRGVDSERVLDARNACLDRARRELGTLTELFAHADRALADRAVEAVYRLRDPASCRVDLEQRLPMPLPERDQLDRAAALYAAGRERDASAIAKQVLAAIPPGIAPQLVAQALLLRAGDANLATRGAEAEQLLFDALAVAERARDDRRVVEIWLAMVGVYGANEHKFEQAHMAIRATDAVLARIDADSSLASLYAEKVGATLLAEGKVVEARVQLQRALAGEEAEGLRPGNVGALRGQLCDLETRLQHFDAARPLCTAAVAQVEAAFGPDHPLLAQVLVDVGLLDAAVRQWDAAERAYEHALAIFERRGTDHLGYAIALSNLATIWATRENYAKAVPMFERARAVFAAHYPTHPQRVFPLIGLADGAYNNGDFPTAIKFFEEARDVVAATYASDSVVLTQILYNLSNAYTEHHDFDKADAVLDQVIARATSANTFSVVGRALEGKAAIADQRNQNGAAIALRERAIAAFDREDDPYGRAWTEQLLGDAYLTANQPARAIAPLEHALDFFGQTPEHRYEAGGARFSLAKALWDARRDRARAVVLAKEAAADLAAVSVRDAAALGKEVAAWLAQHR